MIIYIRFIHGIFGREGWPEPYIYGFYTVILAGKLPRLPVTHGVFIQFWPTLLNQ